MISAIKGPFAALDGLPAPGLVTRLARCVALTDFRRSDPPSYLFASRRRNRCNPQGVECVYFSEGEGTASVEYAGFWAPLGEKYQPKVTFFADLSVAHVIDLVEPAVRTRLGVTDEDLFGGWRRRAANTRLQKIGLAVSRQARFAAIRFPSAATHRLGRDGSNVVVFRSALKAPDSLVILGRGGAVLDRWP
jgi:RES domain-containing protein